MGRIDAALTRMMDFTASLMGLVLLSPIFVLVSIAVKWTSTGPVFYRQTRIGREGRPFQLLKFRTMVVDADKASRLTTGADPRITRIGRFLRKSNLDELPQLLSVLRGEMALVGPRPEVPEFVDLQDALWAETLKVRPGMTAPVTVELRREGEMLAKFANPVEGYRREILPEKLRRNVEYVRSRSLLRDMGTIFATFGSIISGGSGAPPVRVTPFRRLAFFVAIDVGLVMASVILATWLRFDGTIPSDLLGLLQIVAFLTAVGTVAALALAGVYRVAWSFMSLRDIARVGLGVAAAAGALAAFLQFAQISLPDFTLPRSIALIQAPITFCALAAFRLSKRAYRSLTGRASGPRARTLLVGAGDAGAQVLRSIQTTEAPYHVVGFLDDDRLARGTNIHGARVLGPLSDLEVAVKQHDVSTIVVCLASAPSALVQDLVRRSRAAGVSHLRIVPPVAELVNGSVNIETTRDVSLEDLLGRQSVKVDASDVEKLLKNKRVVVTGGAGTIGSELVRQIARFRPARLTIVDVDESRLHDLSVDLARDHGDLDIHQALVDVRDPDAVNALFAAEKPQLVFHAAAYKHVPMMELYPLAALRANVMGTDNVVNAAEAVGTERFVLISTDKAVDPSSIMGASKRLAELAMFADAREGGMIRSAVRFGNVIGSRGSVIPIFQRQLKQGGPITVTHPDMERFFMMTSEAVQLVLQAATMGTGQEMFVLDMGKPVRILDVAKEFIRLNGLTPNVDIDIKITGLRPGEKLVEILNYNTEILAPTRHPMVRRAQVIPEDKRDAILERVTTLVEKDDVNGARAYLGQRFPTLEFLTR